MTRSLHENTALSAAAYDWAERLVQGQPLSPVEEADLAAWLSASDQNSVALEAAMALEQDLAGFSNSETADALIAEVEAALPDRQPDHAFGLFGLVWGFLSRPVVMPAMGGVVAALAIAVLFLASPPPSVVDQIQTAQFETAIGDTAAHDLADGSRIALNTQTRLSVAYSAQERRVELIEGEALFEVAPDASRPFIVATAQFDVRAVGTAFNINRAFADAMTVTVVEGIVDVQRQDGSGASVRVAAGQQIRLADDLLSEPPQAVEPRDATAWQQGAMVFHADPVDRVVREFRRYRDVQVEYSDESLKNIEVAGRFEVTDPNAFFAALEALGPFEVEQAGDVWHVRPAQP